MGVQAAMVKAEGTVRTGAVRSGAGRCARAGAAQAGYEEAFVEAYRSYYSRVFAYVYSRVGNVELAKDLVAGVFEKAYAKGHTLRESAAYATWLFVIAKNAVIGHYRRHKRESEGMDRMKESLWLSERPSNPEDGTLQSEATSNLMRHLRRLSERDQELLSLRFDGELSDAEISCVLNISKGNVRVSIFRALRRLRSLMVEETEWATAYRSPFAVPAIGRRRARGVAPAPRPYRK